jgi:hypothetical protein
LRKCLLEFERNWDVDWLQTAIILETSGDRLTVGELIDLVAYLRTLRAKPDPAGAGS